MAKVIVTRRTPGEYDIPGAEVVIGREGPYDSQEEVRAWVASQAPVDVIVSMYNDVVDDAYLDAAGPSLKGVVNFAVGYENIDVEACARRGIKIGNTPKAVTEGTADMAMTLMLAAARRLTEAGRYARSAEYAEKGQLSMSDLLGVDLAGRTLLIVGAGRIGYATAMRTIGWGMKVLYVARSRHYAFEFAPLNAQRVELDDGLAEADFISVHVPYSKETHHLINARRIGLMKKRAVIVNTSRGAVIEEQALIDALRENRIFGAGLDVYEHEPNLTPGLAELDNAVLTPHIGSGAGRYREMMADIACQNVRAILAGDPPPFEVTP